MSRTEVESDEKRLSCGSGFKQLAIEMLESAATDLARPLPGCRDLTPGAHEAGLNRESAKRWIEDRSANVASISFSLCCDALGIDPRVVAAALLGDPKSLMERLRQASRSSEPRSGELEHCSDTVHAFHSVAVRHTQRSR
uniref:hypothetical protein n=1 Tax=Cupriavidus gilardii TaxID=82541 RepID=UPI00247AF79A|nr:hypothetical protein [Cupriavidus gilardii]